VVIRGGSATEQVATSQNTNDVPHPLTKEIPPHEIASKFGWNEEINRIAETYDPTTAPEKLNNIIKSWQTYRRELNRYYVESGDRDAVCERLALRNEPCPPEHHLNLQLDSLLKAYALKPDRYTYAEAVYTFNVIKRHVDAIRSEMETRDKKVPAQSEVAVVKRNIAKKPFSWDDGIIRPLDGEEWQTHSVAYSVISERSPTVVAVGGSDTLIFAFEVSNCSYWCSGTTSNSCIIVGHSYNKGFTMNLDICIYRSSVGLKEPAIGADPYRRQIIVAYSYPYSSYDYDIEAYIFHISNFPLGFFRTIAASGDMELTPYVGYEFNWGRPGCYGRSTSSCSCSALDNWAFIAYNRNRDPYVKRSTDCGSSWSLVYNDISSDGSAYASSQIMLETSNDPRRSSSVCSSYNGGDNTIQGVFTESDALHDNEIWHIYTDASRGWGNSWVSTILINNYYYRINQPWMAIARTLNTSSMTHLILFESQFSSTDGDIMALHGNGLPPSGWFRYSVDYTSIDSRTPTVHTDARWQWCPGATTVTASKFHAAFYHKCPNTYDGRLCNESPSTYNNTFRVAVLTAPWNNANDRSDWGSEYCTINHRYADTIAIDPPPAFGNGGVWQNWWQINGTTFRATSGSRSAWWFGALWVYKWSSTDYDLEWSILDCLTGDSDGEGDLATEELPKVSERINVRTSNGTLILSGEGEVKVFASDGRLVRALKVKGSERLHLPKGTYFVKIKDGIHRVVLH